VSLLSYLPTRSAEEILAGEVRVVLGRRDYVLPVLPIERNEQWTQAENTALGPVLAGLDEQQTSAELFAYLCRLSSTVYAQLVSYDELGIDPDLGRIERVLPPWTEARKIATESEIVSAFLGVLAAAYPLAVELLRLAVTTGTLAAMASRATASEAPDSSAPISRSERRSAGRRARRAAA
jgi:hypothetical protein